MCSNFQLLDSTDKIILENQVTFIMDTLIFCTYHRQVSSLVSTGSEPTLGVALIKSPYQCKIKVRTTKISSIFGARYIPSIDLDSSHNVFYLAPQKSTQINTILILQLKKLMSIKYNVSDNRVSNLGHPRIFILLLYET